MFSWFKLVSLFVGLLLAGQSAWAGVVVGGTRVIYDAGKREASISVRNPDKDKPYLIQSWVENEVLEGDQAEVKNPPFVITPPLFRLDSGQENVLRIVGLGGDLPSDRESLYWLNIKSIPSAERSNENRLQITVKTRIKMMYRPVGLKGKAADAYKALVFSRQGDQLTAYNPTPYYVAFHSVYVGGQEIENAGTVAPYNSLNLSLSADMQGAIKWKAINDYGGVTAEAEAPL